MCGIAGLIDPTASTSHEDLAALARTMADAIAHRGPDDAGTWVDAAAGVALGHRRLSIIDLSPHGHQPMVSASGRYVIVYNGEIYNHEGIRAAIDAVGSPPRWRGHSDTEVMLAAFERYGIDDALARFNGMFAFALWDRSTRTLHLARDRLGEKPLYYGMAGGRFAFASELSAMSRLPGFDGDVDRGALASYLRLGYVPSPRSIVRGIAKLPPGTRAELTVAGGRAQVRTLTYWDIDAVARAGLAAPSAADEPEALALLRDKLEASVALRMVADVPVGAFLSGGIDSSLIVALMQRLSSTPVRTFTIGFDDPAFDEAPFARAVARHLRTDHTEVYVTAADALAVVPRLPTIYDEPFADASQIPTVLVSQIARSHVTVSLSGDAGDELFAGYERYVRGSAVARVPAPLRAAAGNVLRGMSPAALDAGGAALERMLPRKLRPAHVGEKLAKLAPVLGNRDARAMYEGLLTHWRGESVPAAASRDAAAEGVLASLADATLPFEPWMMLVDQKSYLPDDILVKVDRAAMAVGLETRVPLLDHTLVEHAWTIPLSLKLRDGRGKYLLRALLATLVPPALTERPKRGFAVPLAAWLRGPLRDWGEALLDETAMREQGFLDASRVRARWSEHVRGTRDAHDDLWPVLVFQAWLEHARRRLAAPSPVHA
jgi:asparagine synthase (glutamine-hydrolysing)